MPSAHILVLGFGLSGKAMVRYFLQEGHRVRVADERKEAFAGLSPMEKRECRSGPFDDSLLEGIDRVAISPGIAVDTAVVARANMRGIEVVGEIELFARALSHAQHQPRVIAITGTNGKTTVTALTAALLQSVGVRAQAAGNIGPTALEAWLDQPPPDVWVLELSSFQLETTESLYPNVATVLNVSEDHLDRHHDMVSYARLKARIFDHAGCQVLSRSDSVVMGMAKSGEKITFGLDAPPKAEDFGLIARGEVWWLAQGNACLMPVSRLPMTGRHGVENALAALALCQALGLGYGPEKFLPGLMNFHPLPHRGEKVAERQRVAYYDDSKGTNVGATLAALDDCASRGEKVVLIAGGDGKGQDFTPLTRAMNGRVRALVLLGKDADHLASVAPPGLPVVRVDSMEAAVRQASENAEPGDAVLLSPACSSLDMFANYVARSNAFRHALKNLPS